MKCYICTLRCTVRFTAWLVDSCFSSEFVCSWIPWWNEPVAFYRPRCLLLCCYFSEHHPHDTFYQFRPPKRLVIYHLWFKGVAYFSLSLTYSSSFLCASSLNMPSLPIPAVRKCAAGCPWHFNYLYQLVSFVSALISSCD